METMNPSSVPFSIGDRVKLSPIGVSKNLYGKAYLLVGEVIGFGQGPNTQFCVRVNWSRGPQDELLHWTFLRKKAPYSPD